MYLSPDVGSRAPPGLAWGLSNTEQDRKSLVTALLTYSGARQATKEQSIRGRGTTSSNIYTFFIFKVKCHEHLLVMWIVLYISNEI